MLPFWKMRKQPSGLGVGPRISTLAMGCELGFGTLMPLSPAGTFSSASRPATLKRSTVMVEPGGPCGPPAGAAAAKVARKVAARAEIVKDLIILMVQRLGMVAVVMQVELDSKVNVESRAFVVEVLIWECGER